MANLETINNLIRAVVEERLRTQPKEWSRDQALNAIQYYTDTIRLQHDVDNETAKKEGVFRLAEALVYYMDGKEG